MTKDEILSMARESDLTDGIELDHEIEAVMRFAVLVAAKAAQDEREACAQVCDQGCERAINAQSGPKDALSNVMLRQVAWSGFDVAARAIRSRG